MSCTVEWGCRTADRNIGPVTEEIARDLCQANGWTLVSRYVEVSEWSETPADAGVSR